MKTLKATIAALTVGLFLVMATDYVAMAANGKPLILGQLNKATKTTTIKNSAGTAAKFVAPATKAPIAVSNSTVISKLNADQVDGKHANQLGVRTQVFKASIADPDGDFSFTLPGVKEGTYLITASAWFYLDSGATGECWAGNGADSPIDTWFPGNTNGYWTMNGVGVLTVGTGQSVSLYCNTMSSFVNTYYGTPLTVTLTPIDTLTSSSFAKGGPAPAARAGR